MFSIDDKTGNVVTTVALFVIAATVLYVARGAFFILLLALLFAYLLEPAVAFVQVHSRLGMQDRSWAIALVYLIGIILLCLLGYIFGPHLVAQIKSLNAALPQIVQDLSSGKTAADLGARHGVSANEQRRINDWLAGNHAVIARIFERVASSAAYVVTKAVWLFAVPILAIFILRDGSQLTDALVENLGWTRNQGAAARIVPQINEMLAKYIRAQLALAGFSFAFYTLAMLALGFPYAFALGIFGGALEFLPAIGWVISAAAILTIGFLAHAHWIWMAVLLVLWRLVQDYVNSPRIMGENLGLQPLTVLFALIVGGQLGGIAGLYLSVPAVAVLRIIWLGCVSNTAEVPNQPLTHVEA